MSSPYFIAPSFFCRHRPSLTKCTLMHIVHVCTMLKKNHIRGIAQHTSCRNLNIEKSSAALFCQFLAYKNHQRCADVHHVCVCYTPYLHRLKCTVQCTLTTRNFCVAFGSLKLEHLLWHEHHIQPLSCEQIQSTSSRTCVIAFFVIENTIKYIHFLFCG